MSTELPGTVNHQRRRLFGAAATTIASAWFGGILPASAQSHSTKTSDVPAIKSGATMSFAAIKQIKAGVLNVGYAEAGPEDGPAVMLLHGWPYDIYSYVDVAPLLVSAGYRVIIPYARGYGPTRFLSGSRDPQRSTGGARGRRHCIYWMLSKSGKQSSVVMTGAGGPRTLLRRYGQSAAKRWFP